MELVRPGVLAWSDTAAWPGRPGVRYTRNGHALLVPERGVVALVDPPTLTDAEREELEPLEPSHVLLTCAEHLREAGSWACPIVAHPRAGAGSVLVGDREVLWGAVEAIHLPHVYSPGETAYLAHGVLVVGDALCGGREDIGVADGEVGIFSLRHVEDVGAARRTLTGLLDLEFDAMCFGHGTAVLRDPQAALRRFLAREDVWGA